MNYGFHPEARLEYREAATFYEARRAGLGAAFTREIESALAQIFQMPPFYLVTSGKLRFIIPFLPIPSSWGIAIRLNWWMVQMPL